MSLTRLCVILAILLAFAGSVDGQTGADVRLTLHRRGFDQFPISVQDFSVKSGAKSPQDSILASNVAQIIRNDLSFHIAFDLILIDSFLMEVLELESMTKRAWKYMGAEHLLMGEIEFEGSDVSVKYELWDLNRMRDIRADGFRTNRANYRAIAHSISDDVVKQVTGMKPLFRSKVAFVSARTGNKEIYVCDYDGANERSVTSNGSINISPVWDSEGKSVYYTSYKQGWPELWRVDLREGQHSRFAAYKGLNSAAAVSPDNDRICLTLSKDGNAELYLLDMSGAVKRRLTQTRAIESSPSFGPGGDMIAFSSDRTGSPQVYLMDSDGLNVTRVTYNGNYNDSPSLSPDGSKIAFVTRTKRGGFDICVVDVTGENFRVITDSGANENPHWAPDSYHLVYSGRQGDVSHLYISDFQGVQRRRITKDGESSNPHWSPYLW
jgi:TolB protein